MHTYRQLFFSINCFIKAHTYRLPLIVSVLLSFALCFPRSSLAISEEKKVILYIYLFDLNEINPGDPETLFSEFKEKMKELYPARGIRKIVTTHLGDLKSQMDSSSILGKDEAISHLVIRGHGYAFDPVGYGDKGTFIASGIQVGASEMLEFSYPMHPYNDFEKVMMNANQSSVEVFSGIRGRFTENPHVLITSCDLLKGSKEEAEQRAKAIAFVLGLGNGTMYTNRTEGSTLLQFYKNPKVLAFSGGVALISYYLGCSKPVSACIGCMPLAFLYWRSTCVANRTNIGYCCNFHDGAIELVPSTKDEYEKNHFK